MISGDLGGRIVEVRHFGFARTPGDLVIWAPDAKVLWVGNMIQAPSQRYHGFLKDGTGDDRDSRPRRDFLPEDATIIPGHGRPMQSADSSSRFAVFANSTAP